MKYQILAGKEIWTETKKVRNIKISFHKKKKNINISSFLFLLCVFFVFLYLRTLPLENATLLYFTILKSHFIIYTIPFYNISSIPNFYFSILFIKIIYLYNKIIYIKTQIKTKTQICNHLLPPPPQTTYQTETHGHATTPRQKSKQMKPTFATTTRDTTTATTHPPPPCKETHKKSKKNPFETPFKTHQKLISTLPPALSP